MTTKRLTAEDLAVIEARTEAATEWSPDDCEVRTDGYDGHEYACQGATLGQTLVQLADTYDGSDRDWIFLAHARTDVPNLVSEVRALTAERDELRAIVEGRKVAPTAAEVDAHAKSHGLSSAWLCRWEGRPRTIESPSGVHYIRGTGGSPWWPLDANGRPCAWPKVTP